MYRNYLNVIKNIYFFFVLLFVFLWFFSGKISYLVVYDVCLNLVKKKKELKSGKKIIFCFWRIFGFFCFEYY